MFVRWARECKEEGGIRQEDGDSVFLADVFLGAGGGGVSRSPFFPSRACPVASYLVCRKFLAVIQHHACSCQPALQCIGPSLSLGLWGLVLKSDLAQQHRRLVGDV